jgi:hypothetical protein
MLDQLEQTMVRAMHAELQQRKTTLGVQFEQLRQKADHCTQAMKMCSNPASGE